ncbi:MAG: glycosyltransferase family 2 protein [Candidatus Omnitrophota bacterium]
MSNDIVNKTESKQTIAAVVVTYNRKVLLLECLDALRKQTHPVDAIYIIDNDSTDGTPEILLEKGYIKLILHTETEPIEETNTVKMLSEEHINRDIMVHYVRMHENTGGAGGFHEGVKRGYEAGYGWLWLMDDDVSPEDPPTLSSMLNFQSFSQCIHPRKKYFDSEPFYWENFIDYTTGFTLYRSYELETSSLKNEKLFTSVNQGCFEGMLINSNLIKNIGYPDKRFFICQDDTIYGFLASLYTNVIYLHNVYFIKKIKPRIIEKRFLWIKKKRGTSDSPFYYGIRNKFLVFQYIRKYSCFEPFKAYALFYFIALKYITSIIIFDRSLKKLALVIKAIKDGVRGRFGKMVI